MKLYFYKSLMTYLPRILNIFFSVSNIMEAVRGRFCFYSIYERLRDSRVILLRNKWVGIGIAYELMLLICTMGSKPERIYNSHYGNGGAGNVYLLVLSS